MRRLLLFLFFVSTVFGHDFDVKHEVDKACTLARCVTLPIRRRARMLNTLIENLPVERLCKDLVHYRMRTLFFLQGELVDYNKYQAEICSEETTNEETT